MTPANMALVENMSVLNDSLCNITTGNDTCGTGNSSADATGPGSPPYALWLSLLLGLMAAVVMIVTVAGNILVLLSFALERNIRQPTNYFIASLAMSDLLIGTFSMPAFTLYLLLGYWPLGEIICDIWLSLDWTVCLASQFTVFFITVDRFFSVKIPAKYRNWRSEKKVIIMIAFTWVIPTLIFFTSIIGWQYFVGERTVKPYECEVQFMSDPLFTFLLTLGYYWTFLFIMIGLYTGIYRVALSLQRKAEAKQKKITTAMELAADKPNQNKTTAAPVGAANKNSKKRIENNNARNLRGIESTTFTKQPAEEDRSSSPAFASDEENSSSGNACATGKTPLTMRDDDVDDDDDEQTCFVNSAVQTDTTYRPSLKGMLGMSFNHVSKIALSISGTSGVESEAEKSETNQVTDYKNNPDTYVSKFDNVDDDDNYSEKCPKPTDKLLENDLLQGCKYIDEDSLKTLASSENIKLLPDLDIKRDNYSSSDDNKLSPVWKRRDARCVLIPEESTMCTSTTVLDNDIENINNDHKNATPLPANGSTPTERVENKTVSTLKNSNQDRRTFGSPLHALVKSMREKQKRRNRRAKVNSKSENRARKALRTITFILGAYLICWTPYHVMILIIGLCPGCTYPGQLYQFTYWLCYLNSPINPFCYALANQQFKRTFIRILKLDCHRT